MAGLHGEPLQWVDGQGWVPLLPTAPQRLEFVFEHGRGWRWAPADVAGAIAERSRAAARQAETTVSYASAGPDPGAQAPEGVLGVSDVDVEEEDEEYWATQAAQDEDAGAEDEDDPCATSAIGLGELLTAAPLG